MERSTFDWPLIGRNVRLGRTIRGYSQEELARRSGLAISTIQHIEWGRPVHGRSVLKVCEALDTTLDSIRSLRQNVLTEATDFVMFRREEIVWTAGMETRARVPADNMERIQSAEERTRQGRLGFVSIFVATPNFIMPKGQGLVLIELFGKFDQSLNATIYRDALLSCVSGKLWVGLTEATIQMRGGDVMGYHTKDLRSLEPCPASELPVRLTWTGGTRMGNVPVEPAKRARRPSPNRRALEDE